MDIRELQVRADELGVDYSSHASKPMLVRAIQRRLGQPACFATDGRYTCTDYQCEWRADCLKPIAVWLR